MEKKSADKMMEQLNERAMQTQHRIDELFATVNASDNGFSKEQIRAFLSLMKELSSILEAMRKLINSSEDE